MAERGLSEAQLIERIARACFMADEVPGVVNIGEIVSRDFGDGWTVERDTSLDWKLNQDIYRRHAEIAVRMAGALGGRDG